MPPMPPAGMSAWEQEEYRLWLGSIGWYGKNQVRYYHALLMAHRADRPTPTAPLVPVPDGVITGPDGLRSRDGWPEWAPGVFGPVPISIVEAVQRGEMRRNPATGFYERVVPEELIRRHASMDPDALHEVEDFLPGLDGLLRALLPEPARSWWIRLFADFAEGRIPVDQARGFVALINRAIAQNWPAARKPMKGGLSFTPLRLGHRTPLARISGEVTSALPKIARGVAAVVRAPLDSEEVEQAARFGR